MLKKPKVTLYIPVFNKAKYVTQAITSVFRQTFKDWELLIINDGSTDESEDILRAYESYDNVTVVKQDNKGLTVTCNIALRLAKGDYFMRLDADDYLDENALLVMSHYLDKHPDVGLVYPDYYLVDTNGDIITIERREKVENKTDALLDLPAHGACTMFRKRILLEMGGYNEEIPCQDGYDIWLRFIDRHKVGNINLPLFYYRRHDRNLTNDERKILEVRQKIKRKYAELKGKMHHGRKIRRIAIVPARSHSNVMVRMALERCAGKPLINYTLDEALASGVFDRVVVVSEDEEIIRYTREAYPAVLAMKRSLELARRNTALEKTIQMALDTLRQRGEEFEEAMLLFIEAPLKRREHIQKAVDTMCLFDTDSVISLCETQSPYYVRGKQGLQRVGNKEQFRLERKVIFRGNGALYLFKTKNLKKGAILGKKVGNILMLREDSINILTAFDYKIAEFLLKERNGTESSRPNQDASGRHPGDVGVRGVDPARV